MNGFTNGGNEREGVKKINLKLGSLGYPAYFWLKYAFLEKYIALYYLQS